MEVKEQYIKGKNEDPDLCEDRLYVGPDYLAVIDGVTDKHGLRARDGRTGGVLAADTVVEALREMPAGASMPELFGRITESLQRAWSANDLDQPPLAGAALALYSRSAREVWRVGSPHVVINGSAHQAEARYDLALAEVRALYLHLEIRRGRTIKELSKDDPGREFIFPLLQRQHDLANDPESPWGYPVLDGTPIPLEMIEVLPIPDRAEVVLASDGYPGIPGDLEASERELAELLRNDPLLIKEFKSTKGLRSDQHSYDDRCYLRFVA
jgi:hypothetical protein